MKRSGIIISALLIVVAGMAGWLIGNNAKTSTTTSTTVTSTTTTVPTSQPATAVWPFANGTLRFTSPVAAATSFAVDYLGFTSPIVGAFQQGDTRSGEVPVRASASGVVTTVLVRQLDASNTWWVLGASSPSINVTSPATLSTVTSPVTLAGTSTAYEAVVNVDLRVDGSLTSVLKTTVMGGSMGVMGKFSKTVSFPTPNASAGALMFRTLSAKDGSVIEASVIRINYAG